MEYAQPESPYARREVQPNGAERRVNRRVPLEAEIGVYSDSNFYTGFTQDISAGGLFVATYDLHPIGTSVEVEFALPDGHQLKVKGIVRWLRDPIEDTPGVFPGMGVQFAGLSPQDQQAIEEFIANRPPMFFDDDEDL